MTVHQFEPHTPGVFLGEGVLTWDRGERVSDRYGTVYLIGEGLNSLTSAPCPSLVDGKKAHENSGRRGDLIAVVQATRESTHIGDLFRGVSPRTPEIGQVIVLGTGTLFCEKPYYGGDAVGLLPDDGRSSDWLNIRALYDAHEQSVKLYFHPG